MRLVADQIPAGSHGIRVWLKLQPSDHLPEEKIEYDFACNLIHVDEDTCEVAHAMGKFTRGIGYTIGRKAQELGYKRIYYCRPTGKEAIRWADYLLTHDGLDYYEVDLEKVLKNANFIGQSKHK